MVYNHLHLEENTKIEENMMQIIKAYLDLGSSGVKPEIRRFGIRDDIPLSYESLCEKISSIFVVLHGKEFVLHWKDSDGDYIAMSSDEELTHALANVDDGIFRVYVTTSPDDKNDKPHPCSESSEVLHANVVCDNCNGEIRRYRYKCLQCADFDLCDKCHAQDAHPAHDMVKITSPMPHQWLFPGWRRLYSHIFGHPWQGPCSGRGRGRHNHHRDFFGKANSEEPGSQKGDAAFAAGEQNAEFLRNIGNTVAAFLDPLGISVKVDVEHSDGEREACNTPRKENEKNSKSEADEKTQAKTLASENISKAKATEESGSSKTNDIKKSPTNCMVATPSADTKSMAFKDGNNIDNDSPNGAEGWTVLNPLNPEQNENSVGKEEQVNTGVIPKAFADKKEVPQAAPKILHPDPKIAKALCTMTAMGFDNTEGWLLQLLECKQGNITDVLDTLYPNAYTGRM